MQFHKPQRQPIAAVSPFVMHVTGKAMHQVDSEIAHFRPRALVPDKWKLGRIEFPAAILDPGDHVSLFRCYHRSTSVQSTVSTTALTVASSTRSASASSAATVLR